MQMLRPCDALIHCSVPPSKAVRRWRAQVFRNEDTQGDPVQLRNEIQRLKNELYAYQKGAGRYPPALQGGRLPSPLSTPGTGASPAQQPGSPWQVLRPFPETSFEFIQRWTEPFR